MPQTVLLTAGAAESSHDLVSSGAHDSHHSSDSDTDDDQFLAEVLRLVASGVAVMQAILQAST